jgi:3-dehydroquinate dehydratase
VSAIVVAALGAGAPGLAAAVQASGAELLAIHALDARLASGGVDGLVIVSDALDSDLAVMVAGLLGEGAPPAIEVHSERWDGFHRSLLSPACKGVISGFGLRGVAEAVSLLREDKG